MQHPLQATPSTDGHQPRKSRVKSADRVVDILQLMAKEQKPLGASDIADLLQFPKSSVHALLSTLNDRKLLDRDAEDRYTLSVRLFALANAALAMHDLRRLARDDMMALSRQLGVTCNLGVLDGHNIIYLEKVSDYSHPVQITTHVGATMPAHATALGKVMVAELDYAARQRWLTEHSFTALTSRTRTSPALLISDLDRYLKLGYAVDNEEFSEGVTCVASAVRDYTNEVVAAVSVTGITSRLSAAGFEEQTLGAMTVKTGGAISERAGYLPQS